jgi:diadenosine tetraphosphate (Ap4A) HIT family hydrolase
MTNPTCPFCFPENNDIVRENAFWYARWDAFPATRGHMLVIPFRHCTGYFDTTAEEQQSLPEMLIACKKILDAQFSPAGYNIVINVGEAADQRVMHCHVHIIPRYTCPADNPPGGIKGIIFRGSDSVNP